MSGKRKYFLFLAMGIFSALHALSQTTDFSISPDTACAPATINFTNLTTGNPTAIKWSFGDGRNSFENNPAVLYNIPGTYIITLTAYYKNGTTGNTSKTIHIFDAPVVNFTADSTLSCKVPFTVNFTDNTPGAVTRTWDFGDRSPAITTAGDTLSHTYQYFAKSNVKLTVTNQGGCSSTLMKPNYINSQQLSQTRFDITPKYGCIPLTNSFSIGTSNIVNDPVLNFQWDFGDPASPDNLLVTTQTNATHVYNKEGIYNVKILVTTNGGCTATMYENRVSFAGTPPTADFTFTPPGPICASQLVTITADTANSDLWQWDIGDYGTASIPNSSTITHKFQDTGNINVTLIAYNKGCPSALVSKSITVSPPIADFSFQPGNCINQDTILFKNTSLGGSAWQWNFGDPGSLLNTATSPDPIHIFSSPGQYNVTLKVTNSTTGCIDSISKKVYVLNVHPTVNVTPRNTCKGTLLTFYSADSLVFSKYTWYFGDNSPDMNGNSIEKAFTTTGIFTDTLITTDINNCTDTVIDPKPITIEQPIAKFTSPSIFCFDQPALFRDQSTPYNSGFILTKWSWDFGDGTYSDQPNPLKTYQISSGNVDYTAKLTVTDNNGCADSASEPLKVNPTPILITTAGSFALCSGQSVQLNVLSDNPVKWLPDSNLSCNNCASPIASPPADTKYIVSSSNNFGCTNEDTISLSVSQPFVITASPKATTICPGVAVTLSVSGGAAKYAWDTAPSLSCTDCLSPIAKPGSTTIYHVTGYDSVHCFTATDSVLVNVLPVPPVSAGPNQVVTVGSSLQLNAAGAGNIISWQWSPADYLTCTTCPNPVSTPRDSITYTVKVTDDKGCINTSSVSIHLICSEGVVFIPNTFTPNGDGLNDIFFPRGKGVKTVHYFRVFNRWGQIVFESTNFNLNDINHGWDGTYKGKKSPSDVYTYSTEMVCDNNQVFQLKGNLTLLR